MKTDIKTSLLLITIMLIVSIGSLLFTIHVIYLFSSYNIKSNATTYSQTFRILYMFYILAVLIFTTWIIIILIKHNLSNIVYWLFIIISSLILLEFFAFILAPLLAIITTIILIVYYVKYAGTIGRDIINIILFISISSFLSLTLGFLASIILTAIIAVYDYIAVFKTKHMITLVEGMDKNAYIGSIILMAKKLKRRIMIGGGDLVFPAILFTSTAIYFSLEASYFTLLGAIIGLAVLIFFGKKKRFYPAMTFIGPSELIMLGLYILISVI